VPPSRSADQGTLPLIGLDDELSALREEVAHRLWCDWPGDGRVRKIAVVAEKRRVGLR
jgi:hypothetical protein